MTDFLYFDESDPVESETLDLIGLWVHDPEDASNTVKQYPYGKNLRSYESEYLGTEQTFAGRRFPVVDYGEHQKDKFTVGVHIVRGDTYYDDLRLIRSTLESKKVLVFRDGRGRCVFGAVTTHQEEDDHFGILFTIEVSRVHREITEVA